MIPKNVKLKSREITVPGDKSLSHRSVLFAALSKGNSKVTGFLEAEDPLNTMSAFAKLGLKFKKIKPGEYEFTSPGKDALVGPDVELDFGNAGTGIRLSAGLICGLGRVNAVLTGDDSLRKRPMSRIIKPLSAMGASIVGLGEKETAPLKIEGKKLKSFRYESPIASAQIKSCLMLAAIASETDLEYSENILSRDHTENMFRFLGNKIRQISPLHFKISPPYVLNGGEFKVPGDISSAAFFLVLGVLAKEGNLLIKNIGLNPARTGILTALELMGAKIEIRNRRIECGEPVGDLKTYPSTLKKSNIPESLIPAIIDEIPVLSVAGLFAEGGFEIRHAEELRAKESDRIHTMVSNFRALGIEVEEYPDGYAFDGASPRSSEVWKSLSSGKKIPVLSYMDHRIAMSFLILKALSGFSLEIDETSWIETSFPGFETLLESCLYE
ncbi:3-phosphoshikimate 1-carboxyvinyltransferase [Leptospira alstonii]|uniref:3-phosphoshikimate 1-carboxyvinyltransferase n=2 Tax=Leptospira alstonii TaxID=28452 RepID=M6CPV6_9LEPT|nr:3-phosphoshikimate 1-carboxyvinyltransferase [Leptospira alstonii]EMJ90883.1 3-phosphoshikimate 1-carboxyvinyltransferase [Leptospira alstonii serovar Sichuan str. 79601]EQA81894.1 3-phosphoshikimate 1-carboxyvinyltransferase [Leptospira alstonii serovar Pingchang str. 80-412]